MQTVILDFNTRVEEINKYFLFLEELISERTKLSILDDNGNLQVKEVDSELVKTLKANSFLLLYNLIESSMTNAIQAIFDKLINERVAFDSISIKLKKIVVENFKNRSPQSVHTQMRDISLDIIKVGFNRKKLFSGNINAEKITKTAEQYGFSHNTDYDTTKHGRSLHDIKEIRNDLAHGDKSFAEVGRGKSIEELIKIKDEVVEYIKQILNNIESYLISNQYLAQS
jgi:hypothetical protein